jgi:predicted enzyme related to lactoylglutathione lyase
VTGRVTGIGGVFFSCPDPEGLLTWYASALGLPTEEDGGVWFEWLELDGDRTARSVIHPLSATSDRLAPGTRPFMVRYRVDDLDAILTRLRETGDLVVGAPLENDDGRFGWVIDPDGQKVELWEPTARSAPPADGGGAATGIGGIFFKSEDRDALKQWYRSRLGVEPNDAGYVVFSWRKMDGRTGYLSWEVFASNTDYFDPSERPFMINLRVRDLDELRVRLIEDGVAHVDPGVEEYEYGKFGWIVDPAGIRIELWEPNDGAFD